MPRVTLRRWNYHLGSATACPLDIGSATDLLLLVASLSLMPLFAFLRREFLRCRDSTVFASVSQMR